MLKYLSLIHIYYIGSFYMDLGGLDYLVFTRCV